MLDTLGEGRTTLDSRLTSEARERVIRLIADHVGEPVTREEPRLSGVLPSGERFQGFLPPVTAQPAFSIRKRPPRCGGARLTAVPPSASIDVRECR